MHMTRRTLDELTGAIFLIGFGCLFWFGFWPGILFLVGGISLIRAFHGRPERHDLEAAGLLFIIGIWALLGYSIGALFILGGISMLVSTAYRNWTVSYRVRTKPKPDTDSYLD